MSNQSLNAFDFAENSNIIYNERFENILVTIIACYKLMKTYKVTLINDENDISDKLTNNYLNDNHVRNVLKITDYLFEREVPEKTGRVDIKIISRQSTFVDTKAYYIIECKRLNNKNTDGKTGLNAGYISEGIARFVSDKYSMHENTAGMIGFVVEKMDIHQNVFAINILLNQHFPHIDTEKTLTYKEIVSGFKYSYFSRHKIESVSKIIYHLMFDFSDNIAL